MRLKRGAYLDPREAATASVGTIHGAVNIPFSEISEREHELPPREKLIEVVGPRALASETVAWLRSVERQGVAAKGWEAGKVGADNEILRLWEPQEFLAMILPELRAGSALDLACGSGREAVYMAAEDWDVMGVDSAPEVVARARGLEERYSPRRGAIDWREIDLERGENSFERKYDLITMFRYLHRPLFSRLREWLRPGGSVICETFTTRHRERYGRPARRAHVLETGELRGLFSGFEIQHYQEGWYGAAHTSRIWARLPK